MERNIAVTADGKTATTLVPGDAASNALIAQPVLGVVAAPPIRALVLGLSMSAGPSGDSNTHFARKGVDDPFTAALWSVDPATGKGVLVEHGDYDTAEWAVDLAGEARVRLQVDQNTHRFSILGRAKGARIHSPVWSGDPESHRSYHGYSVPDDGVYVGEDGGIVLKRLADGQTRPVGHKGGALNPTLVWDQVRQTAVGVKTQAEKPAIEWLDPEVGAVHASLSKAFAGKVVNLSN
ncbi:MAG: prolyl oligopeptidase family protein [Phenylobacterium sp.]|nr:prolyl oligopeptidase family protein [Phenylobacterium sp.]